MNTSKNSFIYIIPETTIITGKRQIKAEFRKSKEKPTWRILLEKLKIAIIKNRKRGDENGDRNKQEKTDGNRQKPI